MKKFIILFSLVVLGFTTPVLAQDPAIDQMLKDWERAKTYTKEYLDAMPEAGFAFKPTPEMRSFAEQMLHLTDANFGFAAAVAGKPSPIAMGGAEKSTDKSKAATTKMVMDGYDFVIATLKEMKPGQLADKINFFKMEMTKGTVLSKCFEHQTHHRGQSTVYIRLQGGTPPKEKLF